jgi:hypothetical protein
VDRLLLNRLTVGQHGLRYEAGDIHRMMDFVADGGIWTETALRQYADRHGLPAPSLIQLSEFPAASEEAALLLVHDVHHRLVATHLAGREFVSASAADVILKPLNMLRCDPRQAGRTFGSASELAIVFVSDVFQQHR